MVAVDGSEPSMRALCFAVGLVEDLDEGALVAVYAPVMRSWPFPKMWPWTSIRTCSLAPKMKFGIRSRGTWPTAPSTGRSKSGSAIP